MKCQKIKIQTCYNLEGDFVPFPDNPLNGTSYSNADVKIKREIHSICGMEFECDVVCIEGQEPIKCELIEKSKLPDGTLLIEICQDWG